MISTGGSVCYCDGAMKSLKKEGIVVYIKVSYENLKRRLGNLSKRGVVIHKGSTLLDLYKERTPLYEKYADVIVDVTDMSIEAAIEKIKNEVEKA